ncbi:CE1 family esterase [Chitinophaga pinensis]|uniref:Phospholipase/Carboxylesterase n=1 Tax=Chitinophaga pinensis (strain ATCC 43595 / DSM 2588 / LMG 13176 / NBRC 15968 / NCIMB 11800 / UQM 2034) TaxID=485918 RepID=A0A979G4L0_CHIPD|nr:PHB depolymerase family esterase [Chitinophaga pinensis]ACU60595.1 phospholipase/Carboxylesterase [Chitinophaga pinensis DSM 2588]
MYLLKIGCISLAVLLVIIAALYSYYVYTPIPKTPPLSATIRTSKIKVGELERSFLSYVPAKAPDHPALVIMLHGSGLDGKRFREWTGYSFDQLADKHGFLVAYPDGYKGNWNDCRINAPFEAKQLNIDDMGFLHTLIAYYERQYNIDPAKVFVFGYSNGGQMAFRLAMETPEKVAAIAAVCASLPDAATCSCTMQGATPPVLLINGTADKIIPYKGGEVTLFFKKVGIGISAPATAKHFADRNNAVEQQPETTSGTISQRTWIKEGHAFVKLISISGGGHTVPQQTFRFPRLLGMTSTAYDSPSEACHFFGLDK